MVACRYLTIITFVYWPLITFHAIRERVYYTIIPKQSAMKYLRLMVENYILEEKRMFTHGIAGIRGR